ncbi:amidophosphoribosyltransferase [Candidatus Izimaplasma bacterium ZiA1]|uniref:amidophosphoribosyltransferase n=1 Tax=Candidatus Izimoplasma sp. ZiA1 TaxID=2024899 RepID=UPI000BAA8CF4|nr:amidophosphoribosyltransferase [Candidatus Izimaplasma bacterium ZiA1]
MSEIEIFYNELPNEECGVFGVINVKNASEVMYYGLHSLQHRGQEGCGIISSNTEAFYKIRGEGLVTEVFNEQNLKNLEGNMAIGHVRYSTSGGGGIENVQPFLFRHHTGDFALCHNGNLVNSKELKHQLENQGSIFQSTSDTEIFAHLIKKDKQTNRLEAIKSALNKIEGAFAFLAMSQDKLYIMRDKNSLRPLSLGKLNGGYVVSSETCAFEVIGATFVRDINPGEILIIDQDGNFKSDYYAKKTYKNMCAMEYIYFSRPDSDIEGTNVHSSRKEAGRILAKEAPVDCDIIIGVPDSSISAAVGFSEELNIPNEMGLIKNKYVGRTFIAPSQHLREKGVKMKLSPIRSIVENKRICLVDDSIVRGTTSKKIIKMLKDAGALEVHMRIASPPITHPCFYGVDTSTYEELISSRHTVDEVREIIGADSLAFISKEGILKAVNRDKMCLSCFSGKYPTYIYQNLEEANKDGKF